MLDILDFLFRHIAFTEPKSITQGANKGRLVKLALEHMTI